MKSILTSIVLVMLLAARKDVMAVPTYTIPVVVHVLYNTAYAPLSNISDAQVLSQIDVLNQDFQLLNPDAANVPAAFAALKADCQIQFTLAKRDPLGNPTTGIIHKSTTKTLFSQSLNDAKFSVQGGDDAWPSNQYLNIWLVASMVLDQKQDKGYAQAPGGAAATDGIAMYFSSFGTIGSVNLNSKGHMATHLVGHWLNLQHPWGPGLDNPSCTATDDVDDTPPQSGPSGTSFPYAAPAFPHISCGNGPNGDLFMNFMDWTAEASRCMFTQGQKARMQAVLAPGGARASLAISQGSTSPANIPVVVHLLYNPGTPQTNISDAQIQSQIDVLNQDFGLLNTDAVNVPAAFAGLKADCKIQFSLAKRDPQGNGTTGIIRKSTAKTVFNAAANDAKFTAQSGDDAWPSDQYLNIWVVPALAGSTDKSGAGYAQFPGGGPAAMDGVVIRYNAFGNTGTAAAPFNKGRIATHMVGHWLGLYHPWGPGPNNSNCTATDYIGDTPNQGNPNYGCPSFPRTSCQLLGGNVFNPSYNPGDLFMNFMDYTDDACSIMFTQGQKARMQAVLAPGGARASLASSKGGVTPPPSGLNVTEVTSASVMLKWTAVPSASNYTVQWKADAGSTWTTVPNVPGIMYLLHTLTPSTAYSFQVLSNRGGVASAYSNIFAFTTPAAIVYNIPVVVHVLHNVASYPTSYISDAQVQSQIDVLNQDFQLLNPDAVNVPAAFANLKADCGIQFCLAKRDPLGNVTTGILRKSTTKNSIPESTNEAKFSAQGGDDAWPSDQYLNIWVIPPLSGADDGVMGYAQFPDGSSAATDGVVIDFRVFCNTGAPSFTNKGRAATHLIGHWLNLEHLWGHGVPPGIPNCTSIDSVDDTPLQGKSNGGVCPAFPHISCSNGPNGDLFMNFMDYTYDDCKSMFTHGQSARMRAVLASGGVRASLVNSQGCSPPGCNAPIGLNVTNITSTGATLGWTIVATASNYTVQWKPAASSTWNTIPGIAGITYALSSLTPGTSYSFKVLSNCGGAASAYSNEFPFATACTAPGGLTATGITSTGATLGWTPALPASNDYTLQWKPTAGSTWTTVANITGTTYTMPTLTPATAYSFQIRNNCGGIPSGFSNVFAFTTTCPVPVSLSAIDITSTGATLNWTAALSASNYTLQWKPTASSTWNTITNIASTTYALSVLTPATAYSFQILTNCGGTPSAYSSASAFTTICPAPTGLNATVTSTSATLNWNSVPGVNNYALQWKTEASSTWTTVPNISSNTYTLTSLTSGTMYYFQVSSNCSIPSAYSAQSTFVPGCPSPTGLNVTGITANSAMITWNSVSNADFYYLVWKPVGSTSAPSYYSLNNWLDTSHQITGLTAGINYYVDIASYCTRDVPTGTYSNTTFSRIFTFRTSSFKPANVPNTNLSDKFTLYPNPTRGEVSFEYNSKAATIVTISIIDQNGRTCKTIQLKLSAGQNKPVFNISDLSAGFYFVRMVANEETLMTKLFLER